MADPGFWNDADRAREVIAEANSLKAWTDPWNRISGKVQDLAELGELLEGENDSSMLEDWAGEVAAIDAELESLEAVIDVLPHALDLLAGVPTGHP